MTQMTVYQELETLESVGSRGQAKYWKIRVLRDGEEAYTQTEAWQETGAGESKRLVSTPSRVLGKNIGRANETSPVEQAVLEATSKHKKKLDKGYWVHGKPRPVELPLPMLALHFKDRKGGLVYPVTVQPKLDGVRMLSDGKQGWSRGRKVFPEGVVRHLMFDTGGRILDGEMMLPAGDFSFEETTSAVKTEQPNSRRLLYFVYDIVDTELPFREREAVLEELQLPAGVFRVPGRLAVSEAEIQEIHEGFVERGHEGSIIRNRNGKYKLKDKSPDLLKHKDLFDDEFTIVGVREGVAKHEGAAILVCANEEGEEFRATPKMSVKARQDLWRNRDSLIGKRATVRYPRLTERGVPKDGRALAIRDYE